MTEEEFKRCIEKICQGDKSGLKNIYVAYLPYIYRIVYGIVGNRENAEDITGDFFVKLWSLAPQYRPGNGHKGYLATIARNMAVDFIRKTRHEIPLEELEQNVYENSSDGEKEYSDKPLKQTEGLEEQVVSEIQLKTALEQLKPEERRIIDMKVLGEMTFREIAEILGIPMGTVTWRYQEGIKRLRRYGYE